MKRLLLGVGVGIACVTCAAAAMARSMEEKGIETEQEFRTFFEEFVALGHQFDPALIDRYADDAVIRSLRHFGDGTDQTLRIEAEKWKELLRSSLQLAEERGDRSEYTDVTVTLSDAGDRATIRAARYSVIKCFTDRAYYMVVERRDTGLEIVEEYSESTFESHCEPRDQPDDLELLVAGAARAANSLLELPVLVDEDTRLVAIRSSGKDLEYEFAFFNYAADELDAEVLVQEIRPGLALQACSRASMKSLMDRGANLVYLYRGNDGSEVATIRLSGEDCQ